MSNPRSRRLSRQFKKTLGSETAEEDLVLLGRALASLEPERLAQAGISAGAYEALNRLPALFDWLEECFKHDEYQIEISKRSLELASAELLEKTQQIESLVNALGEGFLMFNRQGLCLPTFSKACEELLGLNPAGKPLGDILDIPAGEREAFEGWLRFLFDEPISFESLAEAGPSRLASSRAGKRHVALSFRAVRLGPSATIEIVVMVASDRTNEILAREEALRNRNKAERLVRILRRKNLFLEFIAYFETSLDRIRGWAARRPLDPATLSEIALELHTLKGAAGAFLLGEIHQEIHRFETEAREGLPTTSGPAGSPAPGFSRSITALCATLDRLFNAFLDENRDLLGNASSHRDPLREVPSLAIESFGQRLVNSGASVELQREYCRGIAAMPLRELLIQHEMALETAAKRLGKQVEPLLIEGGDLLLIPGPYQNLFCSLLHLIRNAVDHGIEPPEERAALGKPVLGKIALRFASQGGFIHMEIEDDGRGIDPSRLQAKLYELGREEEALHETDANLLMHVFDEGFSTVGEVSEISGRGIGLCAVKKAVEALGGKISLESVLGKGTKFKLHFPSLTLAEAFPPQGALSSKVA